MALVGITLPASQHLNLVVWYLSLGGRSGRSNPKAVGIVMLVIELEFGKQGVQC